MRDCKGERLPDKVQGKNTGYIDKVDEMLNKALIILVVGTLITALVVFKLTGVI